MAIIISLLIAAGVGKIVVCAALCITTPFPDLILNPPDNIRFIIIHLVATIKLNLIFNRIPLSIAHRR